MLTMDEIDVLRRENGPALFRRLDEERREFLFGVEDHRDERGLEWGGEFRLIVNRNISIHFVPRFNDEMERPEELPQFCVFADDDRAGEDDESTFDVDGESLTRVVFYVAEPTYARLAADLASVVERYGRFDLIPDTYFLGSELISLLLSRVLEHPAVRAEREFDFRKGISLAASDRESVPSSDDLVEDDVPDGDQVA